MLENIRGHSRASVPPLHMPSPLPHDLCHEWNVSRQLPALKKVKIGRKNISGKYIWKQSCIAVVQSLSHVQLFATPWTAAHQASLSFIISQSLLKLMPIESVMPSNHLILCHPLLLPSIFPSTRVFSSESALLIRWPKYWGFSISPSNEYSGLMSFKDWLFWFLCCLRDSQEPFSKTTVQKHQFFDSQPSLSSNSQYKITQLLYWCWKVSITLWLWDQNLFN